MYVYPSSVATQLSAEYWACRRKKGGEGAADENWVHFVYTWDHLLLCTFQPCASALGAGQDNA